MPGQIAVIGECMIEVKPLAAGKYAEPTMQAKICYGGDTLNTAVYLARQGIDVDYVSALGDDPMSDWMLGQWREEGIGCQLVERVAGAVPGLYLIDVDETGERSFHYWRDQSPARRIFDDPQRAEALHRLLRAYPYLYLSGVTLALYSETVRVGLFGFLDQYRAGGGQVVFDNNYRPRQWASPGDALSAFELMYCHCDIALPTIDDDIALFGGADLHGVVKRLQTCGVREIVLKQGADGCTVVTNSSTEQIAALPVEKVVDTTAAGDSFNAGYLAARLTGRAPREAAVQGNRLAAQVVQHSGAIMQRPM